MTFWYQYIVDITQNIIILSIDMGCLISRPPLLHFFLSSCTWCQSCCLLSKFGRPPKYGRFQEIAQKIAQNFCAIFKMGHICPKKFLNAIEMFKKLLQIAQNFYIFVKAPKKIPKSSWFEEKEEKLVVKNNLKTPKKLPNYREILIWWQLCLVHLKKFSAD